MPIIFKKLWEFSPRPLEKAKKREITVAVVLRNKRAREGIRDQATRQSGWFPLGWQRRTGQFAWRIPFR
jgi:hypothetical protein